jgi:hypothetical protein
MQIKQRRARQDSGVQSERQTEHEGEAGTHKLNLAKFLCKVSKNMGSGTVWNESKLEESVIPSLSKDQFRSDDARRGSRRGLRDGPAQSLRRLPN